MKNEDQMALTRYLLGESTEPEQEAIESRYVLDDGYFEQLAALETELIRDYIRGDLPEGQRRSLERRLSSNWTLRSKVDEARKLTRALGATARNNRRFGAWARHMLAVPLGLRPASALATVLIALVPAIWLSDQYRGLRGKVDRLDAELRKYSEQQKNTTARPTDIVGTDRGGIALLYSLELTPGLLRGAAQRPSTVIIPPVSAKIRFQLNLDRRIVHAKYKATIKAVDEPRLGWIRDGMITQSSIGINVIVVELESGALPTASDYLLTLSGQTAAGAWETVETYAFRVLKQ